MEIEGSFHRIQDQPIQAIMDKHIERSCLDVAGKSWIAKLPDEVYPCSVTPKGDHGGETGSCDQIISLYHYRRKKHSDGIIRSTLCREMTSSISCSFLPV